MAKKNKSFLPKRVAGVRVPKRVRKGRIGQFLASRAGQALIAEAVLAAGAVAGAKKAKDSPGARDALANTGRSLKQAGADAGRDVSAATSTLAYALGEAARSFADAMHRDGDGQDGEGRDGPAWETSSPARAAKKKPEPYQAQPI
jgi:hypothetical protein